MPAQPEEYEDVGFIRYSGKDVEDGIIDAGGAGSALLGLDEAIRYFNTRQSPDFAALEYDIPIQTRKGSWEAVVMGSVVAVGGVFAIGYAKKAGEKLAENDFKDVNMKDVLRKSMAAIHYLARLIVHTQQTRGWESARFAMSDPTNAIAIPNEDGKVLEVPVEFFQWYQNIPPRLLTRMTAVVRPERALSIGANVGKSVKIVKISERDKYLFEDREVEEELDDILFPEMVHGSVISIVGRLIRGNEASNSLGLEYEGHVINCVPAVGSIRQYKAALFLKCHVQGRINRHAKNRFVSERRPTIILGSVKPLETDLQGRLFGA